MAKVLNSREKNGEKFHTLEFTQAEAMCLLNIVGSIGGKEAITNRKFTGAIFDALHAINGLPWVKADYVGREGRFAFNAKGKLFDAEFTADELYY